MSRKKSGLVLCRVVQVLFKVTGEENYGLSLYHVVPCKMLSVYLYNLD